MKKLLKCEVCGQREDYCHCPTGAKIKTTNKGTSYTCAIDGCAKGGCVSPDKVAPMRWLCRYHAEQEMGMEFSHESQGVSPAVAMGSPIGTLINRALIKTDLDVKIVQFLQQLAGKGICTKLADNGGKRNGMEAG